MFVVDRLNKHFGGLHAIADVSLHGEEGEILGVIGPNGAGKSTLFNLVTGVHGADSGSVTFGGRELTHLPAHRRARLGIARTFQLVHMVEGMSVLDNVSLGLYAARDHSLRGLLMRLMPVGGRQDVAALSRRALEDVGLAHRAEQPASTLAYGERRLLEVARAIVGQPSLLLLDEPAAGMNAEEADRLGRVISGLRRPGRVILLVEHNVAFVMRLCDRIVVLDQGRVLAEGTPDEVQADGAVIDAYLGTGDA